MRQPAILIVATAAMLILAGVSGPGFAADPPAAWFVPPPANDGIATSVKHDYGSYDEVTVTAARRPVQRSPHGEETRDFQPQHSDAASPDPKPITPSGYCSSSYQTVAGQAGTGADMVGMGSGHCQ